MRSSRWVCVVSGWAAAAAAAAEVVALLLLRSGDGGTSTCAGSDDSDGYVSMDRDRLRWRPWWRLRRARGGVASTGDAVERVCGCADAMSTQASSFPPPPASSDCVTTLRDRGFRRLPTRGDSTAAVVDEGAAAAGGGDGDGEAVRR